MAPVLHQIAETNEFHKTLDGKLKYPRDKCRIRTTLPTILSKYASTAAPRRGNQIPSKYQNACATNMILPLMMYRT